MATDDWITSHEDLTDMLSCTQSQKVVYAGLKFRSEAKYWWKFKKLHLTRGQGVHIPLERFKQEFNDRFFPHAQRQQCARNFQDLKQGTMSVEHYSTEFQKLSRYAPYLILNEETKLERFRDGLVPHILERFIVIRVTDYTEMGQMATMAKKGIKVAAADYISRKWSTSTGTLPSPTSKR
jgi:hypothetical protein